MRLCTCPERPCSRPTLAVAPAFRGAIDRRRRRRRTWNNRGFRTERRIAQICQTHHILNGGNDRSPTALFSGIRSQVRHRVLAQKSTNVRPGGSIGLGPPNTLWHGNHLGAVEVPRDIASVVVHCPSARALMPMRQSGRIIAQPSHFGTVEEGIAKIQQGRRFTATGHA